MVRERCERNGSRDDYMASSTAAEVASDFCYSDHPQPAVAHLVGQIPPGYHPGADPIFSNLTQNVDLTGFGPKVNLMAVNDNSVNWPESKQLIDDSSMGCVFPCQGNERPSQGLSLSLSSADPSSIGLQPFQLRPVSNHQELGSGSSSLRDHHHQHQGSVFGKSQAQFQLRSSKYLGPVQELLNEFCSLGNNGSKQQGNTDQTQSKLKTQKSDKQWEEDNNGSNISSSSNAKNQPLSSLEFMELQKRKAKLLSLLEEVDRRYRHYCDQMKAVVSSFEAVAGQGAAKVYSALALKAMSRHFRCLRDGIVGQIKETKSAMGDKDPAAPGASRGETPKLRIIDQTLRQQRAFQQMNMMESHPWRPQRGLPERSVSILRAWLFEHFLHPYPSDVDKHILARQTGLSRSQVSNWFINARVRLWKPMVEEMYMEELKEQDNMGSSDGVTDLEDIGTAKQGNQNPQDPSGSLHQRAEDQKPTIGQLVRIDSDCLSSIITSPSKSGRSNNLQDDQHDHSILHHGFGRVGDAFGAMELDFSSYNHHSAVAPAAYEDENSNHFTRGGVSLTLGLQQQGGSGGVGLAFSQASQSSLFYSRDHMEECPPVQYSLLDGEGQNLPYRNLMGAQLLHDLAG